MNQVDFEELQKKILRTKRDLKKWETVFEKKYGRPATIEDISGRPDIEKFYKKYNKLKKEFKTQCDIRRSLEATSQTSSQEVEFIKSPSLRQSRVKQFIDDGSVKERLQARRESQVEEMKYAIASSVIATIKAPLTPMPPISRSTLEKPLPDQEAFWMEGSESKEIKTKESTPELTQESTPDRTQDTPLPELTQDVPTQERKKLFLGPRKASQDSQESPSGRKRAGSSIINPFERRRRLSTLYQTQPIIETIPKQKQKRLISSQDNYRQELESIALEIENEEMKGVKIVNHEVNPFRNYNPSLYLMKDPSFIIGPSFFGSEASTEFMIPLLNEPKRRERVLNKLKKGTLGEVLEENKAMEEDIDEDLRQFIINNTVKEEKENDQENENPNYKKKPLQKRQTRLYKLKFVDKT